MTTEPDHTPFDIPRPAAHYQHLMHTIPVWLRQTAPHRRAALRNATPRMPDTFKHATPHQHAVLKTLSVRHAISQNRVDRTLTNLKDVGAFAEPLLQAMLKQRFGLTLDVRTTYLRLFVPTHFPWLRAKTAGARVWSVSLLDAALHNFESAETAVDAFEPDSTYTTQPDAHGHFEELPQIRASMPISGFTQLCRDLDIGQQYNKHLETHLGTGNPQAAASLQTKVRDSQKDALTFALQMAQMQNLLTTDAQGLILRLLTSPTHPPAHAQAWRCHDLTILNARLTGIMLFAPDMQQAQEVVSVVVYIPDDPEHPVKQYASCAAFAEELTQRLRDADYQTFFSRFINHEDRGVFFTQLSQQLAPVAWHAVPPTDARPAWRAEPNPRPALALNATPIRVDPWTHLYRRKLDKILNDARVIAVSTASADRLARWALWDSFVDIASTLLNVAAFVVAPFVPFLGELMMGYMAYQLLDDTFEGVIAWADQRGKEALGHFMAAVESTVQMGAFAVGGAIAVNEFRALLPAKTGQFIDRFTAVKRPGGDSRYWHADLKPYEQSIALPATSKPDARGLHHHQGKTWLRLEDKPYAVVSEQITGGFRIEHPTRPDAYQPALKHLGDGIWKTELDQPLTWDQATLLHRSGPRVQRLNERERLLHISGCPENALRRAHANGTRLPPLFADTVKRFNIDQDIQSFIDQMASDLPQQYLQADPMLQLELLLNRRGWPEQKGLRLHDGQGQTLWQSPAPDIPMLQIDATRLKYGDLLKTVLMLLSESELKTLMGEDFGTPVQSLTARTQRLRLSLSKDAQSRRRILFDQRYRRLERGAAPNVQRVMDAHPDIAQSVAQAIVRDATRAELEKLGRDILSPRLTDITWEAALQVRVARAYEGLELQSTRDNPDTERLALHTLEQLPDWPGQLRLEVRQYAFEGILIDSIGSLDAPERKVVVLTVEGNHQAYDASGSELSGGETFYDCLLRALPDQARAALKLQMGEGERLRRLINDHPLNRQTVRSLLAQQPQYKLTYNPIEMRLLGGTEGYRQLHGNTPTLTDRVEALLPHLSPARLEAFVQRLQQHPSGPRAELTRLIAEYSQLQEILGPWSADIPHVFPGTRFNLAPEQILAQREIRREFAISLLDAWRFQQDMSEEQALIVSLSIDNPIIGDLPLLQCDFPGASHLTLEGHGSTLGAHQFLYHFTGVQRLNLRGFNLRYLPDALAHFPNLEELVLSDCGITLTPQSRTTLAGFKQLKSLDLYKNPLGLGPDVEHMPNLEYIDLAETGIDQIPDGLLTRPALSTALLNDNAIVQLPEDIFTLQPKIQEGLDLGKNPIDIQTHERIKKHYVETSLDFGIYAPETDILQAQSLYPLMDKEEASRFVYLLPGTLAQGTSELSRLQSELLDLQHDLNAWAADIPAVHPSSGQAFTERQLAIEQSTRDEFREQLLHCWRREIDSEEPGDLMGEGHELALDTVITGDLPALRADFSHVSLMYLSSGHGLTGNVTRFLESFPKLRALSLREFRLSEIPSTVFTLGELSTLNLSECEITLTPNAVQELAQMTGLEHLTLSNNPLTLAPDVSQMSGLKTLRLDNTEITEMPAGLGRLTLLEMADLSENAITEVPSDLLEWPSEFSENIDLQSNPFSPESLQILFQYFRLTNVDFDIDAVIEYAEMEVSSSEDSARDE